MAPAGPSAALRPPCRVERLHRGVRAGRAVERRARPARRQLMATFGDSSFAGLVRVPDPVPALHGGDRLAAGSGGCRSVTLAAAARLPVLRAAPVRPPSSQRRSRAWSALWRFRHFAGPAAIISAVWRSSRSACACWPRSTSSSSAFRRSRGEARQQLLWLVAGAAPLVPAVVAAFAVSYAGYESVALADPGLLRHHAVAGRRPVRGAGTGCTTSSGSSPTPRRTPCPPAR